MNPIMDRMKDAAASMTMVKMTPNLVGALSRHVAGSPHMVEPLARERLRQLRDLSGSSVNLGRVRDFLRHTSGEAPPHRDVRSWVDHIESTHPASEEAAKNTHSYHTLMSMNGVSDRGGYGVERAYSLIRGHGAPKL